MEERKFNHTRASIVVMSHLSDLQIEGNTNTFRIEFIKYVILKCEGDLNQTIDPEKMYREYVDSIDLPF